MKNSIAFIVWALWTCIYLGFWQWVEQRHHLRHSDEEGT